jgi:hypothetical protein
MGGIMDINSNHLHLQFHLSYFWTKEGWSDGKVEKAA